MSHAIAHNLPLTEASEQSGRAFFGLFVFSLLLVSIPIKNFAYVLPPLYLLAQLLWFDTASAVRTLLVAAFVTAVSCISLFVDSLRGQATNLPGVMLSIVTFLPLFMMLGERFAHEIDDSLLQRIIRCVAWYVIFQALIGAFQFVMSGSTDAVTGTLGLLDFHRGTITITQLYFGFMMLSMVLFLMLDWSTWLAKAGIVAGLVVSALSQSGHQSVFFVAALGLFAVLQSRRIGWILGVSTVLAGLVVLVFAFYPDTAGNARQWYDKTVHDPHSPKILACEGTKSILADPKNLLLGAGMGQYSSRATLITSGEFLSVSLPSFMVGQSDYYHRYMVPGLASFAVRGEGSAISKPYFTWLSVLVEFGLLQFMVIVAVIGVTFARCLRLMYATDPRLARAGMLGCVGLALFLLCCAVENYVEFPQAVFVPYVLFVVGFSWARRTHGAPVSVAG